MNNKTFIIEYGVYTNTFYESHTIKVKNFMSQIHAKVKLESYLKNKHCDFKKMVVYKCTEDIFGIFNLFNK